jgi:hypothetical protein
MKKIMIMLILSALAFTVQAGGSAGIVNGDFNNTTSDRLIATSQLSGNPISVVLDKGWYTNATVATQGISLENGSNAFRNAFGPGSVAGIAQFFTCTTNGSTVLTCDVQCTDADSDLRYQIILFGYTLTTSSHVIGASDAARLLTTSFNLPANGLNYNVTQLVLDNHTTGTINGGNWATITNSFTASSAYEFYGISIMATHPDAADVLAFDNVKIGAPSGPAPQPATMFIVQ